MTQIDRVKRNQKIKQLAQDGKTADEISELLSMKRSRVMTILRSYKVKPGKVSHSLECEKAQNIIAELKKGTKQNDIAKKFNTFPSLPSILHEKYAALKANIVPIKPVNKAITRELTIYLVKPTP